MNIIVFEVFCFSYLFPGVLQLSTLQLSTAMPSCAMQPYWGLLEGGLFKLDMGSYPHVSGPSWETLKKEKEA